MPELWQGEDPEAIGRMAADEFAMVFGRAQHPVLAVPTGGTPRTMYASIVERIRSGTLDIKRAWLFNLDEYLDLPVGDPGTFRAYMTDVLWNRIPDRPAAWTIPDSSPQDVQTACRDYDHALAWAGTLDLAVVGIGENGHLAFNEPGTSWTSATHVAALAPETRQAAAAAFGGLPRTPRRAITMGLGTLFASRRIVLLATGGNKAAILAQALAQPPDPRIPASILQTHPNVRVLVDRAAASKL